MSLTNANPAEAARAAKSSSRKLATLPVEARNAALDAIHSALSIAREDILEANAQDLKVATKSAADGELSQSILKRLDLSRKGKYEDMLKGILDVKQLEDPGMRLSLSSASVSVCHVFVAYVAFLYVHVHAVTVGSTTSFTPICQH